MSAASTRADRPEPLHVIDWGTKALGPRYTELNSTRHWRTRRAIWRDTGVGYVLYHLKRGQYVPFLWKVHRDHPRPPLRR